MGGWGNMEPIGELAKGRVRREGAAQAEDRCQHQSPPGLASS